MFCSAKDVPFLFLRSPSTQPPRTPNTIFELRLVTVGFFARGHPADDAGAGEKDAAPNSSPSRGTAVNAVDGVGIGLSLGDARGHDLKANDE